MNQEQMNVAKENMIAWLTHPAELGKAPARMECAGEFELHDLHYYIFKYKKSLLGKWLLGVCGGFEGDELENCGHTFSQMLEYKAEDALKDAINLVEYVRNYIMKQAENAEEKKSNPGTFLSFILLKEAAWSKKAFKEQLKADWGIEEDDSIEEGEKSEESERDDMLVMSYKGAIIAVSLNPTPVPGGEAEYHANSNYRWREAVEVTKQHKAHLMVAIMGRQIPVLEAAQLLVKVVVSCCNMGNVLGVYANETVYQPEFYVACSEMMEDGGIPILNLVWFGLYGGNKGLCACTCGLSNLGYDEIEILDTSAAPGEVVDFLLNICAYVVTENVVLRDGETIGFTPQQKLPITRSKGIAVDGESLKIAFPG